MNPFRTLALAAAIVIAGSSARGGETAKLDFAAIVDRAAPSFVQVSIHLRHDKGEAPYGGGWSYRCPNCGRIHSSDADGFIEEERPAQQSGFVLSPTMVLTLDPLIHRRFLDRYEVGMNGSTVGAKPIARATRMQAVLLELDAPLEDVQPLQFDPDAAGPFAMVEYKRAEGDWTYSAHSFSVSETRRSNGERFISAPTEVLIVGADGTPIGVSMTEEMPVDGSWKGSPLDWDFIPNDELVQIVDSIEQTAAAQIMRIALSFRSPPKDDATDPYGYGYGYYEDAESDTTERNVHGVLIDPSTLLVIVSLKPEVTARLERVRVFPPSGEAVDGTFAGTLTDYGAFIAQLDTPLHSDPLPRARDIFTYRNDLLIGAEVRIQGENRVAYTSPARIASFETGWKEHVYPSTAGQSENVFLYDRSGALIALPIQRRKKVSLEERWGYDGAQLTAMSYLHEVFDDLESNIDPDNTPLSEEEENRLAWLGVELQPMDTELARMHGISHLTNDGATGGLVIHIYPGSPAETAGLQTGDVLLRLHVADQPRPIDVVADDDPYGYGGFPWDHWDELPEEYFDQIPPPWPTARTTLNQRLTSIGFGKDYEAEIYRNEEVMTVPFTVTDCPTHYASAKKIQNEELGVTVRDITFEARRYFRMEDDDPGVIISKVERGSKASIRGIKPYEIIVEVDDEPVTSAEAFQTALERGGELRLFVKRMVEGRVVKVQLDAGEIEEAEGADEPMQEEEAIAPSEEEEEVED